MLGSILIQPQMLSRMQNRGPGDEIADELSALAHHLLLDPAAAEAVLPAFTAAGQRFADNFLARLGPRLPQALNELRSLLDPLTQPLADLASQAPAESIADLLEHLADSLDRLTPLTGLLSETRLRNILQHTRRILTDTLNLSQVSFRTDFLALLADARSSLQNHPPGTDANATAIREGVASLLGRLERDFYPHFPTLDLDPDRLLNLLMRALHETPLAGFSEEAECLLERIGTMLGLLAEIARIVAANSRNNQPPVPASAPQNPGLDTDDLDGTLPPAPANGSSTAGPARDLDGEYCWYASWLYARQRHSFHHSFRAGLLKILPGFPGDEVWLSTDRKCLLLRCTVPNDEVLHEATTPFVWHEAPQFAGPPSAEYFSFRSISPAFLEEWTQTSSVLQKLIAGFWHFVAAGRGEREYACNIPLGLWNWSEMVARGSSAPLPSLIVRSLGWGSGSRWLFSSLLPMLTVLGGSFEGVHTRTTTRLGALQWLTLIGGDALSAYTIHAVTQGVHDLFLSVFTLLNQTDASIAPATGETHLPANWRHADPVIDLVNQMIGFSFRALIPADDYGLPFDRGSASFGPLYFPWMLLGAPLANVFGNFLGTMTAAAISGTDPGNQLGEKIGLGALLGTVTFIIEFYAQRDGSTDGGRYNPRIDPGGKAYSDIRRDFIGYPDRAASPYRLPYAAGTAMYVGQANLGFFSHARWNRFPQVYAYDFAHDFGDEILAVRAGTVVDFFDWIPDNTNPKPHQREDAHNASATTMGAGWRDSDQPSWNFIAIRHDDCIDGQDRGQGGDPVTTYAIYGHGATNGVRELWKTLYAKEADEIIGTRVRQGNPVMRAGSTGVSFHNHLHLHVVHGPAPVDPPSPPGTRVLVFPWEMSPYTLPFVFADAPGNGVLRNLRWYRSANRRTTELPA